MRRVLFIIIFLTIPLSLIGEEVKIGVLAHNPSSLLEKNQNLVSIFFDAIFKELHNIPNRTPSTQEQLAKLTEEYNRQRILLEGALQEALYEKDLLIHSSSSEEMQTINRAIDKIEDAIDQLEVPTLNASDKKENPWDIQYLWKDDAAGSPLPMPISDDLDVLREYSLALGADGLVLIYFEEIESDLWVSVRYYNRLTHSISRLNSELITSKEGVINSDAFVVALRGSILGRSWSQLIVENPIPSLEVQVTDSDGSTQIYYPGDSALAYLTPGIADIVLTGYDYISQESSLTLEPRKSTVISGYLDKKPSQTFYLDTHQNYKVYGNEFYIGRGLQELKNLSLPGTLRITNGVNDFSFILREESNPYLDATILDDTISYQTIVDQREKKFYRSFAFFMLSIPASILTYQVKQEYQQANPDSMLGSFWSSIFYASIAANVVGGIQFFIDLSRFVNAEDIIYSRE